MSLLDERLCVYIASYKLPHRAIRWHSTEQIVFTAAFDVCISTAVSHRGALAGLTVILLQCRRYKESCERHIVMLLTKWMYNCELSGNNMATVDTHTCMTQCHETTCIICPAIQLFHTLVTWPPVSYMYACLTGTQSVCVSFDRCMNTGPEWCSMYQQTSLPLSDTLFKP